MKTDVPYLLKVSTGVFENTNSKELQGYLARRKAETVKRVEVESLKTEINNIKGDLSDIKSLLTKILEKNNGGN